MTVGIEKAFILAAGLGTRLRPLTCVLPKPLLPVLGRPLLELTLQHLGQLGIRRVAINAHHLISTLDACRPGARAAGFDLQVFHERALLDTGGALVNARDWIGHDPVLVHSGDVLTDIDLGALAGVHLRDGNAVTLALRDTGLSTPVAFDPVTRQVLDLRSALGRPAPESHDYANVAVINGEVLRPYPPGPRPLAAVLVDCLRRGERVGGLVLNHRGWVNVGSRQDYLAVHQLLLTGRWRPWFAPEPWWTPEETAGDGRYAVTGATWIARDAEVGPGAALHDTIVWPSSRVAAGARLTACIVAGQAVGPGIFSGQDFCT